MIFRVGLMYSWLFLAAFAWPMTASAWDCHSAHRNQVTITAGAAGHSEEVRIDLASTDFPADYILTPDGDDVRVVLASDDTTPVDHIVTGWDSATRTGTVYIKLPALAANSSTSVYVYYGDGDLSGLSDIDAVFPVSGLRLRSRVSRPIQPILLAPEPRLEMLQVTSMTPCVCQCQA